ncbi:hypothetical protein SHIRM173S_00928 [Streptomyces hirsutus]
MTTAEKTSVNFGPERAAFIAAMPGATRPVRETMQGTDALLRQA